MFSCKKISECSICSIKHIAQARLPARGINPGHSTLVGGGKAGKEWRGVGGSQQEDLEPAAIAWQDSQPSAHA